MYFDKPDGSRGYTLYHARFDDSFTTDVKGSSRKFGIENFKITPGDTSGKFNERCSPSKSASIESPCASMRRESEPGAGVAEREGSGFDAVTTLRTSRTSEFCLFARRAVEPEQELRIFYNTRSVYVPHKTLSPERDGKYKSNQTDMNTKLSAKAEGRSRRYFVSYVMWRCRRGPYIGRSTSTLYTVEVIGSPREAKDGKEFWKIINRARRKVPPPIAPPIVLTSLARSDLPDKFVFWRCTRLLSNFRMGTSLSFRRIYFNRDVIKMPRRDKMKSTNIFSLGANRN